VSVALKNSVKLVIRAVIANRHPSTCRGGAGISAGGGNRAPGRIYFAAGIATPRGKVQVACQFIAIAGSGAGFAAASGITGSIGACFVAAAGQIKAHGIQFIEIANFNETIAIIININDIKNIIIIKIVAAAIGRREQKTLVTTGALRDIGIARGLSCLWRATHTGIGGRNTLHPIQLEAAVATGTARDIIHPTRSTALRRAIGASILRAATQHYYE